MKQLTIRTTQANIDSFKRFQKTHGYTKAGALKGLLIKADSRQIYELKPKPWEKVFQLDIDPLTHKEFHNVREEIGLDTTTYFQWLVSLISQEENED